jgi:hypothetical protein
MIILWCENDIRALYNILSSVYYNMDTSDQGSNAINLVVAGTGRKECVYPNFRVTDECPWSCLSSCQPHITSSVRAWGHERE